MKLRLTKQNLIIGAGAFALALSAGVGSTVVASEAQHAIAGGLAQVAGNDATLAQHRGPVGPASAAAATYIGITEAALRTELQAGKSLAEIAIANGKTRDGLVAALTQAAAQQLQTLVDRKGTPGATKPGGPGGPGGPGFGRAPGGAHSVVTTYLGITEAELRTKLRAGQSLAQIAAATAGKSRQGLLDAMIADARTKIEQARTAGKLTAEQATKQLADLATRLAQRIDATPPAPRAPRTP